MTTGYHDWAGASLGLGDLIIDDRGFPWRVKAFNYGDSNIALCEAVAFNRRDEQAIRLGHVFKVKDVPRDARNGFLLYRGMYDMLVAVSEREKVRLRREEFQKLRRPSLEDESFLTIP